MHLQFFTFVVANVLSCGSDLYFGFFVDASTDSGSSLSMLMHFVENVAILVPINYVLFVHR